MASWRFRTTRVFLWLKAQTWNNIQLSEQRWAIVNQEPRPPNPMGFFLAVLGWLLDTKLHWIARMIFAIFFVINHSYGKPPFTLMAVITWMAIAQFTSYAFSHNCAISLYIAGDLFLIMLYNFSGHVFHDGPFDLKRLIYRITMWDLRLYLISSFGLFYRKSVLQYVPLSWTWSFSRMAIISTVCVALSATALYKRPLWQWVIISNDMFRLANDRFRLLWYRLLYKLSRGFRALCERVQRLCSAWGGKSYYSYKDLNPGQIRLLHLKRRISIFGVVHADLVVVDLVDAPPYEAISYTWGDPTQSHEMSLNGRRFFITENLHDLLYARSSIFLERLLWVDFICINQKDIPEKQSQIPMMRAIYERANRVVIWLGDKPEASMAAAMWNDVFLSWWSHKSSSDIYDTFNSYHDLPRWHVFMSLIHHPYFSRVWICQEVAVSSNAQIYHGGTYISWEYWASIVTACMDPVMRPLFNSTDGKDTKFDQLNYAQNTPMIFSFNMCLQGGVPLSLGMILSHSVAFKSTNPADKIYGILGLVSESCEISISPDYSKDVSDLYMETAKQLLLSRSDAMLVLPHAGIGYPRKLDKLPSWAPDWSQQRLGGIISRHVPPQLATLLEKNIATVQSFIYCAARKSEPQITAGSINETMNVKGIRVGTISKLGPVYDTRDEFGDLTRDSAVVEFLFHWHLDAKTMAQETVTTNPYRSRDEAFWRTLIGDSMRMEFPAPESVGRYYDLWYDEIRTWLEKFGNIQLDTSETFSNSSKKYESFINETFPGSGPANSSNTASAKVNYAIGLASEYSSHLLAMVAGRRFCITDDGYMGLVPPGAKVGDLVCILFGGQTPFLLRSHNAHGIDHAPSNRLYQLVGECYIQGMMKGERMYLEEKETFALR